MRVLIIGGSGFLGTELIRRAVAAGHETAATFATRRPDTSPDVAWRHLDVRHAADVAGLIADVAPSVVLNASSGGAHWETTADGAAHVALAAAGQGRRLVHVSSDAVFSGARTHYDESCPPDPLTPYGAAKAAAETAVRHLAPEAAVARTSLIIGHGRSPHERLVHALAVGSREGALFTDDIRCPVHVTDLAAALWELALRGAPGMFHLAGPDALSRHELGVLIARRDGLDPTRLPTGLRTDTPHPGPVDVRLDSSATQRQLRTRLRGAREFLG
ncbi:sugar nucleotide-binding protein [Streptomyces sp. N35]|uniref:sugar nucleotide-binding protein n=1 Tax=Streptomyces sp. N35 TaxID=2795730 RepID=UPI0018F76F58|nr:sugar nucleotide-binding protein [Streptomyces sp. N35]